MTTPPITLHHHLNPAGQDVLTYVSWALTVVLLGWTIRMGRKEKTNFYVLVVLASMVGAFAEPLYDTAFDLYFYSTHHMQTFYTAFNVPQPVWTHSGYAILYALPAVFIAQKIRNGKMTAKVLYLWALVELAMSCVFEITGINIGTYTYWGPFVLRIYHYPIIIGVLEAAQTICFAVAASHLRNRAKSEWSLFGLFALFPVTMLGVNFGAGVGVIIAMHTLHTTQAWIYLGTVVSFVSALVLIRFAATMLPAGSASDPEATGGASQSSERAPEKARA